MVVKPLSRFFEHFRDSHDRREVVVACIVWGAIILYIPLSRLFSYWRGGTGEIVWDGIGRQFLSLLPFAALFIFNDLVLTNVIVKLRNVVLYVVLAIASAFFMSLVVEQFRAGGVPPEPPMDLRTEQWGGPRDDMGRGAPPDSMRRDVPPPMNGDMGGGPMGGPGQKRDQMRGPAADGNNPPPPPMKGDMGGGPMGGPGQMREPMGGGGNFRPDGAPPDNGFGPRQRESFQPGPMMTDFILALMMMCAGTLVKIYLIADRDKDRLRQLAKEKAEAELEQLRYQVSPHFMMNTLNNIHALVDIDSERAKDTIVRLSRLMRYMLHEGSAPLVPLSGEVTFLSDYIELMRIRYTDAVSIRFAKPADTEGITIPPLLFVNAVENAFKHGVSYAKESFVDVSLSLSENRKELNFCCVNSLAPSRPADGPHGIGLENTKRRLELLCRGKYQLSALKLDDRFVVSMQIIVG